MFQVKQLLIKNYPLREVPVKLKVLHDTEKDFIIITLTPWASSRTKTRRMTSWFSL